MTCSLLPMCVSVITNIGGRAAPVCDLRHIFALLGLHSTMERGSDHGDRTAHKFGRLRGQPVVLTLCPTVFDGHIPTFDVASFAQALLERRHEVRALLM